VSTPSALSHTYANGLVLLAERMRHVRSAAMCFLVPAGSVYDPPDERGLAWVLVNLIMRGAGSRDNRELTLALDNLGLDRDESVGPYHVRFWGATFARNLPATLEIYADILRRPHFPDDELDAVRALALQDIQGLEDEPRQQVLIALRRRYYPAPLGFDHHGTLESLKRITAQSIRAQHMAHFQPRGSILSVAGNIEWGSLKEQVGQLFGDWEPGPEPSLTLTHSPGGRQHVSKQTAQTHIAVAYPTVPFGHREYYGAEAAINVLSGRFSARLFTELRDKRGLCYAVWAAHHGFKDLASVVCYVGTSNDLAQEALDALLAELQRLPAGVEAAEVQRVQANLKATLILREESTSARSAMMASDWFYLGRVRSRAEIQSEIDSLTPRRIVSHLQKMPPRDFTVVTLGPRKIRNPKSEIRNKFQ
jgi:predicted Zn-dependent peptidase